MTKKSEIYLDMDGVCVDFIRDAMIAQGYDPAIYLARWHEDYPGSLFPEPLMEKTAFEFFTHEHLQTHEFWSGLAAYDWFDQLFAELERLGHVIFLTAPTGSPGCVSGKHEWLIEKFGSDFHDFIFTRHKERLAHPNAYLIDDMPFNIKSFDLRHGTGVLFPQIWNDLSDIDHRVDHVIQALEVAINNQ